MAKRLEINRTLVGVLCMSIVFLSACAPHQPAPVTNVHRGPTFHDYQQGSWSAESYEVRRGDTLYSIAFRANMDIRQVAQLNNLQEPYVIFPGQILQLSAESTSVAQQQHTATPQNQPPAQATEPTTSQVRNNVPEVSVANDISPPVVSSPQTAYGENVNNAKTNEIQPIRAITNPRERTIANADLNWQWPNRGQITRRFSTQEPMNRGLEIAGQRGEPVVAAEAGKVVYVGTALRGYGRLIILKHNDDYITAYGHNEELMVVEQQWVEAGQQIATMGSSGRNDVRLRFELRFRGNSVNPENYLPRSR